VPGADPLTLELTTPRLPKRSWVKISQIRTLATERIGNRLGRASPEELAQVLEGLNEILGA
jgi:mRNA interferase MazF